MKIIVAKTAGFCFGVKNAVDKTIEELENNKKVYCLGELVHNKEVTEELIKKGAIFIEKIEEANGKTIIRAHGVPNFVYSKAKDLGIEIKDLTCPKVLHIHNIVKEYKEKGFFIFLVGQIKHPETIGTISFCGENSYIIEKEEDVEKALEIFNDSKLENSLLIAQTTFSMEKFEYIAKKIKEQIENIIIKNTICNATRQRQEETEKLSKTVDIMIVIGGKHSSNSNKLYEIASKNCKKTIFIESAKELDVSIINNNSTVGIIAGASTPKKSIDEVVEILTKK